ncbi:MAG: hypothetical protein AAGU02_08960, partial [Lawsonibacter sp.]
IGTDFRRVQKFILSEHGSIKRNSIGDQKPYTHLQAQSGSPFRVKTEGDRKPEREDPAAVGLRNHIQATHIHEGGEKFEQNT